MRFILETGILIGESDTRELELINNALERSTYDINYQEYIWPHIPKHMLHYLKHMHRHEKLCLSLLIPLQCVNLVEFIYQNMLNWVCAWHKCRQRSLHPTGTMSYLRRHRKNFYVSYILEIILVCRYIDSRRYLNPERKRHYTDSHVSIVPKLLILLFGPGWKFVSKKNASAVLIRGTVRVNLNS